MRANSLTNLGVALDYNISSDYDKVLVLAGIASEIEELAPHANEIATIVANLPDVLTVQQAVDVLNNLTVNVTTLMPGAEATSELVGTEIRLGIPAGTQGVQGIQGPKGDKGDHVHHVSYQRSKDPLGNEVGPTEPGRPGYWDVYYMWVSQEELPEMYIGEFTVYNGLNTLTAAEQAKLDSIEFGATADQVAFEVPYDNSISGLLSEDAQSGIDELSATKLNLIEKGQPNGVASLDSNGLVPSAQLPSYVDDVIEVGTKINLPTTGEKGKIYIVVNDETSNGDTSTYRWTGTVYAMVSNTLNASDVKALYEANPDTNEYSAADKTKLDGIEVGATGDQTANEILTSLKTVDGSGSGLDADLLDGQEGAYYLDASNINAGTIDDVRLPDTITSSITGNSATATKLATARTIGGVSFDGSININLAGVNVAGNQDTSGQAGSVKNLTLSDLNNPIISGGNDTVQNTIGYVRELPPLLGQVDGALYSQAYSAEYQHQIFGDYRTGKIAVRGKNLGTWGNWKEVAYTDSPILVNPTINGIAQSGYNGFKNYIINGKKTVNKRGLISTDNSYNQDRWYKSGVNWYQGIEGKDNLISGKRYTLSWVGTATASYYVGTATSATINAQSFTAISNGSNFTLTIGAGQNLWIKFVSDATGSTFNFVHLEEGSVATPFEHRPYGLELSLCQRYYQSGIEVQWSGNITTDISYTAITMLPVTMRQIPTATYSATRGLTNFVQPTVALIGESRFGCTAVAGASSYGQWDVLYNLSAEL